MLCSIYLGEMHLIYKSLWLPELSLGNSTFQFSQNSTADNSLPLTAANTRLSWLPVLFLSFLAWYFVLSFHSQPSCSLAYVQKKMVVRFNSVQGFKVCLNDSFFFFVAGTEAMQYYSYCTWWLMLHVYQLQMLNHSLVFFSLLTRLSFWILEVFCDSLQF